MRCQVKKAVSLVKLELDSLEAVAKREDEGQDQH